MPPAASTPIRPTGRGRDARVYLEHFGYKAQKPAIRSSDYDTISDPFRYYLTRHLGLSDGLTYSEALSRGSWTHSAFPNFLQPLGMAKTLHQHLIEARLAELDVLAQHHGIGPEGLDRIKHQEEVDAWSSFAWLQAISEIPLPSTQTPIPLFEWLSLPQNQILGFELMGYVPSPYDEATLGAQFDCVVYQSSTNKLWIIDLKTCGCDPTVRLSTCEIEFQTQLYLDVAQRLIDSGSWQEQYDLPGDVSLGGFIHVAIEKPNIKFGQNDRPCEETLHILKSGPRKGQTEVRRAYFGEPLLHLYVERCGRWYRHEGEFSHKPHDHPHINRSVTRASLLKSPIHGKEYEARLRYLVSLATMTPEPANFRMGNIRSLTGAGREHHLLPFYTQPVGDWPSLISELGLIQKFRDPGLVAVGVRAMT